MEFTGLSGGQFENYLEPRSRSNVYSRARLEVKEELLAMSSRLLEQIRGTGRAFDVLASDHHPSLWNRKNVDRQLVFFSRGAEERESLERLVDHTRSLAATLQDPTPYYKYAFLCLNVTGDGFEPAVKLSWRAWVDRDNFLARIDDAAEREVFLDLLASLPEEYMFGLEGGPVHPVSGIDDDGLMRLVEAFRETEGMLSVGLRVAPGPAVDLGPDLAEVASVAFLLLTPVYEFLSWSEDGDFISLRDREEAIEEARRSVAETSQKEQEAFETRRRERKEEQARRFEEQRDEKIAHQRYREEVRRAARAAARQAAAEQAAAEQAAAEQAAAEKAAAEKAAAEKAAVKEEAAPAETARRPAQAERRPRRKPAEPGPFKLEPGVRVEITSGVLRGKWGVVQEVDRHGQAKVVLGSMVTRVPVEDLRQPAPRRPR